MEVIGKLHSFESFGTVDGPGIRFVIFMQGCPLRCKYCHNPDTWDTNEAKYKRTVDFTINEVIKCKPFFKNNGGITITGGEPLIQLDYVTKLFKRAKEEEIHTALDTSGYIFNDKVKEALNYVDLVLLDIKSINADTYKNLTGVKIDNTLKFAEYLDEINKPVWIRYVVVPNLTDDKKDVQALANYLMQFKNIGKIELLPFHKLGEHKWQELNLQYELEEVREPTEAKMEEVKKVFIDKGLTVG